MDKKWKLTMVTENGKARFLLTRFYRGLGIWILAEDEDWAWSILDGNTSLQLDSAPTLKEAKRAAKAAAKAYSKEKEANTTLFMKRLILELNDVEHDDVVLD